ncbi:ribonuclease Y [Enterococcus columbae]|uniref:Ribonuclease Y n=1 Tax=Enterococcus columbae DSM 7374 = ATCC 51263 TaxID=1121865 RepID=S0KG12_9ENTE|nr:ribonuclease Y [Enterococcus columbae]EOT39098.1 2',3'-cyclic-nucleotide 2'-phosphodiesterase [Enterococcus columbae DSM 7374 = ATCC 51263]EOW79969.1 2',3'-cyclic-nucleotide 2'-phosphodiesterase [Enterococcus columbae DSM 7374 = ATCC 51263]OJG24003.1 2,3-cyclic-nucleotide 2-phosphodiesterase [Enterococcus columbae DSM 7374 = ATCC 51263]
MGLYILLAIIGGLIVGLGIGIFVANSRHAKEISDAQNSAIGIINAANKEAETLKKEALLEAKEENQKYRSEIESELKESRLELKSQESRLLQREKLLDRKDDSLEKREYTLETKENKLTAKQQLIDEREKEVEKLIEQQQTELERIAELSKEDAAQVIMKQTEEELSHELTLMVKESEQRAKEEADRKAKNLLSLAIQRCAADQVSESTVSVVTLPNDEMKGRIIGREGRNIRTLETLTGIDLIIDDTPEAVVLSGFDPIRREIARMTLEKLIQDGRIHPARIEEMVEKSRKEMDERVREYGEQAAFEVGAHTLHPDLIKILGRLHFRTSYGQNVLNHSIEVAKLSGVLAAELGEDIQLAKRAGLLHDIGKALDHEIEGSHVEIGAELAAKYREHKVVINAIASHHGDTEATSIISVLVAAADALSAARPGARSESLENYIRRLENLENISNSFDGVDSSFAVQAGREVRVMVKPEEISDLEAVRLVRDIRKKIEDELDYPGHIKVTVIRETRAVDYAK